MPGGNSQVRRWSGEKLRSRTLGEAGQRVAKQPRSKMAERVKLELPGLERQPDCLGERDHLIVVAGPGAGQRPDSKRLVLP